VVVVTVHPSALRPHHLRSEGPARGTYVRLGSTNRAADPALIAELSRRIGVDGFDEEPLPDLDSEAIDFGAASQCFAELRSLRRKDLETLGLVRRYQERTVATVGGILLFGMTVGRVRRFDLPAVPPLALREALVNAVVHADYAQRGAPIRVAVFDDRIEVENPGILLPGLTLDDLRDGVSRVRNRVLARVFKELGLVEQWGTGVQRMIVACAAAGLPAPEFAELGFRFRVTIRTEPVDEPALDRVQDRIVTFIGEGNGRSTAEIATHAGLSTRATQHRLAALAERGFIIVVGSGPRDPRRRWFIAGREGQP